MDTYTQPGGPERRHLALEEKRRIVEETLVEGASVAKIALAHGLNTNLVFNWRRLHQKGLLGGRRPAQLLPVTVTAESSPAEVAGVRGAACRSRCWCEGTIQIRLQRAQVRVEGNVDAGLVRVVLECLRR
jgi:transposase